MGVSEPKQGDGGRGRQAPTEGSSQGASES